MKWGVEVQKTSLERRNLADLLDGLGFRIIEIANCLAITSDGMDACMTAGAAFDLAKRVRVAMTGPARIDTEFQLGAVLDFSCDPPQHCVFIEGKPATITLSAIRGAIIIGPPKGLSESQLKIWQKQQEEREYQEMLECQRARLEPAFRSERAAKALDLLSYDKPTGEILYKIYELAEGHPKNRSAFHTQFGISIEEFRRFQDTVHNPAVSGEWARHACEDVPKSTQPMSRYEAEQFVRQIAKLWFESIRRSN